MDVSWFGKALRRRRRSTPRAPPSPPTAAPVLNGIAASAATNFTVTVTIIAFGTFRNSKGGAKSRFPVLYQQSSKYKCTRLETFALTTFKITENVYHLLRSLTPCVLADR